MIGRNATQSTLARLNSGARFYTAPAMGGRYGSLEAG